MLRRISSKKGKFEGIELGERVIPQKPIIQQPVIHSKPVYNQTNTRHIDKEAHRIASFMQKRKESVDNTPTQVKKYKPTAKIDVQEDSPVSIHVIKRDRISSHRSKPPIIDYKRTSQPPRMSEPVRIQSPIKHIPLTKNIPEPVQKPTSFTRNMNSEKSPTTIKKDISLETKTSIKSPQQRPSGINQRTISKKQERPLTVSKHSTTEVTRQVSVNKPTSVSRSTSVSRPISSKNRPSVKRGSPTITLDPPVTRRASPTSIMKKFANQLKTPVSSQKADRKSSKSTLSQPITDLFRKKTSASNKKKGPVEWSVVSKKTQYKQVVFSFILQNWEKYTGSFITESRLKKAEPHMDHFSHLSFKDRYLLATLCSGIKIIKNNYA